MFYSYHEGVNSYKDPEYFHHEPEQKFLEIQLAKGVVYLEMFKVGEGRYCMKESFDYVRANYALQQYVSENRERLNDICTQRSSNRFGSWSHNSLFDAKRLPSDNYYLDATDIFGFGTKRPLQQQLKKIELVKKDFIKDNIIKNPMKRGISSAQKGSGARTPIKKFTKKNTCSSSVDRNSIRITSANARIRNPSLVGSVTFKDDHDKVLPNERSDTETNDKIPEGPSSQPQWLMNSTARGDKNSAQKNDDILKQISLKLRSKLKGKTEAAKEKLRRNSTDKKSARYKDLSPKLGKNLNLSVRNTSFDVGTTPSWVDLGATNTTMRTTNSIDKDLCPYDLDETTMRQIDISARKNDKQPYDYYDHLYDTMKSRPIDVLTSKTEGNIEMPYDVDVNFPYEVSSPIKSGHGRIAEIRNIITTNANPKFPYEGYNHSPLYKAYHPRGNYLLTCDWDGILKQYSINDLALYRSYNNLNLTKGARAMVATKNSKHIFIADLDGNLVHFTIEKTYEGIHFQQRSKEHESAIRAMAITHDDKYLFTGCHNGVIKQHYIHPIAKCMMKRKNWNETIHDYCNSPITSIVITYDNESMFVADRDGLLRQFSLKFYCLTKKFELPGSHGSINNLHLTADNRSLFLGYRNGFLREVNVREQRIEKDYGYYDKSGIRSIQTTADSTFLFIGGATGNLLQFALANKAIVRDYGKVLDTNIFAMACGDSYSTLWLVDESGRMKALDIREQVFVRDFVVSKKSVYCLALVHI